MLSAARAILLGEAEVVLAGGTESMSNTPYLLPRARWGYRLGHDEIVDGMYRDGFNDPLSGLIMGETAEELAVESGHRRARPPTPTPPRPSAAARRRARRGRFAAEIAPVAVAGRKGETLVDADEHPRDGVTVEALAKLAPVFRPGGTVTAGNASGITDGAAALLVASEAAAAELGLPVAGWLLDWEVVGVDPRIMGIGPVPADPPAARRGAASASTRSRRSSSTRPSPRRRSPACAELPFDPARVNPDGGAIALGHPIGATGARILVTLLHGTGRPPASGSGSPRSASRAAWASPRWSSGADLGDPPCRASLLAYLREDKVGPYSTRSPRAGVDRGERRARDAGAPTARGRAASPRRRRRPAAHRRRRRRARALRRGAAIRGRALDPPVPERDQMEWELLDRARAGAAAGVRRSAAATRWSTSSWAARSTRTSSAPAGRAGHDCFADAGFALDHLAHAVTRERRRPPVRAPAARRWAPARRSTAATTRRVQPPGPRDGRRRAPRPTASSRPTALDDPAWWVRTVQWHPENLVADPAQRALFLDFLAAAARHAGTR